MSKSISDKAQAIIKSISYATLATVSQTHEPWNAPVYFAYDQQLNLYWGSYAYSQHSINIRDNGKAFISIYNSTVLPGSGKGVYIQATCKELKQAAAVKAAYTLITTRRAPLGYWQLEQFTPKGPIRLYQATPKNVWLNESDQVDGTYIDKRGSAAKP